MLFLHITEEKQKKSQSLQRSKYQDRIPNQKHNTKPSKASPTARRIRTK
jgi:hypothetical protein